jgi:hypothetical protein
MAKKKTNQEPQAPKAGEQTKVQKQGRCGGATFGSGMFGCAPVAPGTYKTYRLMRNNPTIALARAAATSPIRAAGWGVESKPDTPKEWKAEIHDAMTPLWSELVRNALFMLDYGWTGFEKVFEIRNGLLQYAKIKPLLVDMTEIQVDKDTGEFAGLKQQDVMLDADKSVLFTNEGEAGDLYGRSRNENCRKEWSQWNSLFEKAEKYIDKAAGVIPLIKYPEGSGNDAQGKEIDNYLHAEMMLSKLGQGNGVYMPVELASWAEDLIRAGVDVSGLMAWQIEFLETKGQHGIEITDMMRHRESLMMRGWLVPERAATEGQYGTKAESETHANLGLTVADLTLKDIVTTINKQVVNPLLVFNHGADAADSVFIEAEELGSDEQVFFRDLLKEIFTNPANIDLFLNTLNVEALLDIAGLPKSDMADLDKMIADVGARAADANLPASAVENLNQIQAALMAARTKA